MARSRDRAFALVLAVVFFVTSFGLTFLVIWQMVVDNKETTTVNQPSLNDPKDTSGQLAGTKLKDYTTRDISDLQTEDTTVGTGIEAAASDTVTVDYTGAVAATGIVFQSSLDSGQPASLSLDMVIPGWKEGVVGMKEGGSRRLYIPAAKAYGANPPQGSGIPANADLVFDIVLHKVQR